MAFSNQFTSQTPQKGVSEWLRNYWRPAMAIQYFAVCVFDFILAPVGWTALQAHLHQPLTQWTPTTLGSGGMYHLAMGAVLGVAAWSRSVEKTDEVAQRAYYRGANDYGSGTYRPRKDVDDEPSGKKPLPGMEE
jgi:hypothetical protein